MKVQFVLIDEPIHIYNEKALKLWQKALWAKELGYRQEYKSNVLPMGEDDFVASHLIAAEELENGELEPMFMYKSIRLSQCQRFKIQFPLLKLLKGTEYENSPIVENILNDGREITYDSSWTINPVYKQKGREFCKWLRDLTTAYALSYHQQFDIPRWITCGVTKFKIDKYFEYLGGKEVLSEFKLPIIDGESVRMLFIEDTSKTPPACLEVVEQYQYLWKDLLVFQPESLKNPMENRAA